MHSTLLALPLVALVGCGDNLEPPPDAAPPPVTAAEYFGLRLGAHWTYRDSRGRVIEKRITSCEPVAPCANSPAVPTYVRETHVGGMLQKVHYLRYVPGTGVMRVREDEPGPRTKTWCPGEVRLVDGPYDYPHFRTFDVTVLKGASSTMFKMTESIRGVEQVELFGTYYEALHVEHSRTDNKPPQSSWYVRGTGEILETNAAGGTSEALIAFEPGFADCP